MTQSRHLLNRWRGFRWQQFACVLLIMGHCGCSNDTKVHLPVAASQHDLDGEDWPMFLGPQGTGVSSETGLPEKWPTGGPPIIWEKKVGTGYSAPSVLGNRLVLHHRVDGDEIVECMQANDAQRMWELRYPTDFSASMGFNDGPICTPLLTDDRCYTFGAKGRLHCLDLKTGSKLWMRDTKQDFNVVDEAFGVGCTPILEDDQLIVLVGGQPNSGVVAFNANTGEVVWESVGKQTWDGVPNGLAAGTKHKWKDNEWIVSYSSPTAATINGKRHILCLTRHGLVSLDPTDGRENFKYWFRSRDHLSCNVARPLVIGDRIFLSAAYQLGSVLLQVNEDGTSVEEVWRSRENMLTHWATPIHVDGFIYGFSGRYENGTLRCLDVETGEVLWETEGHDRDTGGIELDPDTKKYRDTTTGLTIPWPFFGRGSKIQIEDKFIVLGERGTLALVKINSEKYEEISRTQYEQIQSQTYTAPVLSRKRLYLRCEGAMICLDMSGQTWNN